MTLKTQSTLIQTLADMHTYCRPAGSATEREFCARYIAPLPGAYQDTFGNWHVQVGDAPVLWSAHTDTVHWNDGRQRVAIDKNGRLRLHRKERRKRACLGCDDTVGVFILIEMVKVGIPGRYVFHYGEEVGCIGSSALALRHADWLQSFDMAIAFDRGGTRDVITHQLGQRAASDAFGAALAAQLNADPACGLSFVLSDRGVYTDTNEYAELIPECTNLSVGYEHAHSSAECVDINHVLCLLAALCGIDTAQLPIERDPSVIEPTWPVKTTASKPSGSLWWKDDDFTRASSALSNRPLYDDVLWTDDELSERDRGDELHMRIANGRLSEGFTNRDAVYLDPVYRDVQNALRKQVKKGYGK